ncbi:MAG: ACT domain-containing protein, partial [Vallitaleaceae bacterium]|nr:ACT domain-containing protein [Vallitaleaceae bacterium]
SSIGGGRILITRINNFETEFTATSCALIINQYDKKGVISDISKVLADNDINIGTMKLSRETKGETASCIIETDGIVPAYVVDTLKEIKDVLSVKAINLEA